MKHLDLNKVAPLSSCVLNSLVVANQLKKHPTHHFDRAHTRSDTGNMGEGTSVARSTGIGVRRASGARLASGEYEPRGDTASGACAVLATRQSRPFNMGLEGVAVRTYIHVLTGRVSKLQNRQNFGRVPN